MHLGIDFGTTRSVVALADRGNYPVVTFAGHDGDTYDYYPSVCAVQVDGDEFRFGFEALAVAGQPGWELHRSFKRFLHSTDGGFERHATLGTHSIRVVELITRFLQQLKLDLGTRSSLPKGTNVDALPVALAVPANAHSGARLITLEAFRLAGFQVVAMLNEPSAAGVEYAHHYRSTITAKRENVLVYDLGGGTFDTTLVLMSDRKHDVLKSRGITRLGGDDFDDALLDLALKQLDISRADLPTAALTRLQNQCREQKEKMHANTRRILIEVGDALTEPERAALGIEHDRICIVPAEAYRQVCEPLVDRTLEVLDRLESEWSAESGNEQRADLAGVYIVGGASALPFVSRRLKDVYGRRTHRSHYPSCSIAIGLAIALDEQAGFEVTERFSRQFGVFREGLRGERVEFDVIFDSDIELPTDSGVREVRRRYAPTHNVGHYRYVECGWLDQKGAPSGDITSFSDVYFPFDRSLRGAPNLEHQDVSRSNQPYCEVEERYRVDRHGIVELTIVDVNDGYERTQQLTQSRAS